MDNIQKFVAPVAEYAGNVMESCRDKYGDKETPLLADGIDINTGKPTKWEGNVLSNLACQQNFLRTLDGLYTLTNESKYDKFASQWIGYALNELQDLESGMLYWGGHTNYDLVEDKPLLGNHELKCVYPYYPFLYKVNPDATSLHIQGFWNKHVRNWDNLLFNRHGEYSDWDKANPWEHGYSGGQLPIVDNSMLSFINTGSDLIYSASLLTKLSGDMKPLFWAKRLVGRYDQIRNEKTGLGGYQFNHREPCRVRMSFRKPYSERQEVNETATLNSGVIQTRYGRAAIVFMNLYDELGETDGREFLEIAKKDLTALGKYSYDPADHSFTCLLNDGTRIYPEDIIEGSGYYSPRSLTKVNANGLMFLSYAKAYCLTGDEFFWQIARSLAQEMGLKAIFDATDEKSAKLKARLSITSEPKSSGNYDNACILIALMELHKTTGQREYLSLAANFASQLIEKGFTNKGYLGIDNPLPIAILHLAAIAGEKDLEMPKFYPGTTNFDPKVIIARMKTK